MKLNNFHQKKKVLTVKTEFATTKPEFFISSWPYSMLFTKFKQLFLYAMNVGTVVTKLLKLVFTNALLMNSVKLIRCTQSAGQIVTNLFDLVKNLMFSPLLWCMLEFRFTLFFSLVDLCSIEFHLAFSNHDVY